MQVANVLDDKTTATALTEPYNPVVNPSEKLVLKPAWLAAPGDVDVHKPCWWACELFCHAVQQTISTSNNRAVNYKLEEFNHPPILKSILFFIAQQYA